MDLATARSDTPHGWLDANERACTLAAAGSYAEALALLDRAIVPRRRTTYSTPTGPSYCTAWAGWRRPLHP